MTERVLVTGGSGFVGRALVRALREQGVIVDAPDHGVLDVAADPLPDLSVDCLVHLAGRTYVPASWDDPVDFYRVNVLGTVNVLNYCRRSGTRLIYVSGYCYGQPDRLPIPESAPLRPNNPYAFSKRAAEAACQFFHETMHTQVTVVRPFNIYGPGQSGSFLIPHIVEQAIDPSAAAIIVEDDAPRRDYVHVEDVVAAIEALRQNPKPGTTFNVGSGLSHSVSEVARMVLAAAQVEKPIVSRGNRRINDIPDVIADISALRAAVGWSPSIALADGLRGMVDEARAGSLCGSTG